MTMYGMNLTAGGNAVGLDFEVEADTLAEAITLAEAEHPGYRVVRGRALTNYNPRTARVGKLPRTTTEA